MEKLDSIPVAWIIGEGMLIEGVASILEEQEELSLVHWKKINSDFVDQVRMLKPLMIIFELDAPESCLLLVLLKECPGIQMVGIDQDCGQVVVLSSFRKQSKTMFDLFNLVMDMAGKAGKLQKGGNLLA